MCIISYIAKVIFRINKKEEKMEIKKEGNIIAVDVDWVLAKLTQKWVEYYNTIFDDNLKITDIKTWNISNYVKPEAKDFMINILNLHKFYRDLEVVSDSQRVLKKLSKKNKIIIATDPFTRMSFKSKYDWLEEHFPFIDSKDYVFTGNKSLIQADFLIDDGVHNLENFSGYSILYDAPYNKEEERFFRVKNWQDVEHLFEYKLKEVNHFYKGQAK